MRKETILKSILAFGQTMEISDDFKLSKLGDIVDIDNKNRKAISKIDRVDGIYPYCGATKIQGYINGYNFDGIRLLIGEDGANWDHKSETTYFMTGKFNVNNHAHVLKEREIPLKYLRYYLNYFNLNNYITGAVVKKLTKESLMDIDVFFDEENIHKIVSILENQENLIESYKIKLNIIEQQELYYQEEILSGRLGIRFTKETINYMITHGWYINEKIIKSKNKEFENYISQDFKNKIEFYKRHDKLDWARSFYTDLIVMLKNQKKHNIQSKHIKEVGLIPVISQEKDLISGFTDDVSKTIINDDGYIVFGDHTVIFKYINFNFITGADGVKVFKTKNEDIIKNKYLYLLSKYNPIKSTGYNRHFKLLEEKEILYPEKTEEQFMIINFFDLIYNIKKSYSDKIEIETERMNYLLDNLLTGRIRI